MMQKNLWAIIVAGGSGQRFGAGQPKQFLALGSQRVLDYSLEKFTALPEIAGIVLVLPAEHVSEWKTIVQTRFSGKVLVTEGGASRQQSVLQGLQSVAASADWILIHDAARPLVSQEVIRQTIESAEVSGAAVAAIPLADTLKKGSENSRVLETIPREALYQIQTPQVFLRTKLEAALDWARSRQIEATDEATLIERMGGEVHLAPGSRKNFKITHLEDLELAEALLQKESGGARMNLRIGEGYDVHAYVKGRPLILGGVEVPFELGLQGHSDADALLHAISDAILGALALGDLGAHFPDSDPQYRGISSLKILGEVRKLMQKNAFELVNLDATLICQSPKLAPHIPKMRQNISEALGVAVEAVSVKATTEEGLGFTGQLQGLAARAVVLLKKMT